MPAEPERDQWGRYVLPDPATGQIRSWIRTTTFAGTLKDRYALEKWAQRGIITGLARNPRLLEHVDVDLEDKDQLDEIVEQAKETAGLNEASRIGTHVHELTEQYDLTGTLPNGDYRDDVAAYAAAMHDADVTVMDGWVERILVNTGYDVAGTTDRLVRLRDQQLPRVLDVKTGANALRYGALDIAVQLHVYASSDYWYDPDSGLHPMPAVDQHRALVAHMPAGTGQCQLVEIDLDIGRRAAEVARDVLALRQVNAVHPYEGVNLLNRRRKWLKARITSLPPDASAALRRIWPADLSTRTVELDHNMIDKAIQLCELIEAEHQLPFGPSDPGRPPVPAGAGRPAKSTK